MKRRVSFLLILALLLSAAPFWGRTNAATVAAKSVIARIYVNGAYQPTEAYRINSDNYYKIQDIAASVRDLSVRFAVAKSGSDIKISTKKNHIFNGTEYSSSTLLNYPVSNGGKVQVDGVTKSVKGYIINGDYCLTMKEAAKLLGCGFKAVEAGKGADFQLVTSYKYNASGKLERKLNEQGNTAFNRMWEGFTVAGKDSIYFLSNNSLYKMNNAGTEAKALRKGYSVNLNIANDRLYYTLNGNLHSSDLDGKDEISHPQPIYSGPNQQMKNVLIVDDSVYCIYNDYDRWANPQHTSNIYQFEMIGRDMIPDTWMRQTIFSVGSSSLTDSKIATFYIEGNYIYFTGSWINRVKLGDYGIKNSREVLAEGEWYQQQKFSDNKIIMMGREGNKGRWPGKNGYLYTKSINDKDNWSTYLKEAVYTYTVIGDKLVYVQDYNLYIRDHDGKNKRQLLGKEGSSSVLFGIAGDWIVSRETSDVGGAKSTLVKLDGTTPKVKF